MVSVLKKAGSILINPFKNRVAGDSGETEVAGKGLTYTVFGICLVLVVVLVIFMAPKAKTYIESAKTNFGKLDTTFNSLNTP